MTETASPRPSPPDQTAPAVLIAGAGPTGLTLAVVLARAAVSFRLIEAAHGRLAMPMAMTAPDGQVKVGGAEPEELKNRPDIPYTTSLITPEWRTEEALRLRLAELGGAVEFGTTLDRFQQTGEGVSAVLVKDGQSEAVTARWLVGCDGGHSAVRRQAGIEFVGETHEEIR